MLDKKFNPQNIEEKHYKQWESSGAFACNPESNAEPWAVMMPPPNVTGSLHIGHALNNTLQDILSRYFRMQGRDVLWQPGMDHAGIATQMVVERQLEAKDIVRKRDLSREEFVKKVWEWKEESGGMIVNQLRRLGSSPDWERERFTMDEGLSKAVLKAFITLYEDGRIYKDHRLVNWDPKLLTAISDLEVEHKEIKGKMYHFRYPYEDGSGYVSIATTRPETILADGAVAVHPDDERFKDLVGQNVVVPVINRIIPIVADEYVKSDFGSGAVKITAAHDFNDFEVYKRHKDKGIPLINLFTPDGKMNENCPKEYQGLDRFEARKKVIQDFDDLEYLDKIEDHVHQVPYGDRSGVVIEPYLTDQWYLDTPTLAKEAGKAVRSGKTKFHPKQYENMYFDWIDNQLPWCISRQLWWGHRIPAWYDKEGNVFVAEDKESAQEKAGDNRELVQDEDVLDTWFSSALWPFSTIGWPDKTKELERYYPGDVLVTGFDIITFWVSRMMMMGLYFMKEVPFKDVYIHALVRDAKGQKMSKSKGNVMDPLDLIDKFGADALRFTLCAMAAQGRDIKLSEERVEGYRNFATKLWNASRYCEMNGASFQDTHNYDPSKLVYTPNKWIVSALVKAKKDIEQNIEDYRFNEAASIIYHFIWGSFCDWYLEFTKSSLQAEDEYAQEIKDTSAWVLEQILTILNPFMPHITEEIFTSLFTNEADQDVKSHQSALLNKSWPQYEDALFDKEACQKMEWLIQAISEVRSVRADMNVPAGAKISLLIKDASEELEQDLISYDAILKQMARLEDIQITTQDPPKGSVQSVVGDSIFILPIADIIDLEAERGRLEKQIEKLNLDIKKIDQKLENKKFIANAPEDVVAEQRDRKKQAETTRDKLSQALRQLQAA